MLPIGRDREDRLQPAGVLDHDALAHQGRQRLAQPLGTTEVDVGGQRQLASAHVGDERFEDAERLGQGHRPTVVVEQPEGTNADGDRGGALIRWATSNATRGTTAVGSADPAVNRRGQDRAKGQRRPEAQVDRPRRLPWAQGRPWNQVRLMGALVPPPSSRDSAETSCCWS